MSQKWKRVTGADLKPNKALCERNLGIAKSPFFIELCQELNIPVTKRQSSKYSNKKGLVYKYKNGLIQKPV